MGFLSFDGHPVKCPIVFLHLFSLKHGAVGRKGGAGFLVEFTVTFKKGCSKVLHEAQVHSTQTCCWALSLNSMNTHRYSAQDEKEDSCV